MKLLENIFAALRSQPPAPRIADAAEIGRRYSYWRRRIMTAAIGGYATFYFLRSNLPMAAKQICDEFHLSNKQWGLVVSSATIAYALSKLFSGMIGDRANPRFMLGLGLLGSALINVWFGFGHALGFFVGMWAINNVFQGMGAPPCTRLLTYWFSPREIGRAWGVWNASHQIGGALIAVWAGWLVVHFGWRSAFWAPAAVGVLVALWLLLRLTDSPEALGLPPVEVYRGETREVVADPRRSFWEVFRARILTNRKIWIVSGANFFVYIVRIGILTWSPKYLLEAKAFTLGEASYAISGFEIAGIFGAYGAGWLSDRVFQGRRAPVSVGFMVTLTLLLVLLFGVPPKAVLVIAGIFTALGFLVYGPQMLIGVAAADFATKEASASAVGLTGFFGYLGASVCGLATGVLVDAWGWDAAIWFYVGSAAIGSALLAITWRDRSPVLAAAHSTAAAGRSTDPVRPSEQ